MNIRLMVACISLTLFCSCATGYGVERDGRWAIIISGASGDADLQKAYLKEITELYSILEVSLGFPHDQIIVLFDDPALNPGMVKHQSTRENLQAVSRSLRDRVKTEDLVFVFIEGHGSYDGQRYKLNLMGRYDPTGEDLAAMLYSIPAGRMIVVNATSCSGGSLPALSQKGKIVVTATKSGMEKNRAHWGRYFVDALKNNNADSDKNGRVSIFEAYAYALKKVEEYYQSEGNLQTEHAVLNDRGEAPAQGISATENGEGLIARSVYLDRDDLIDRLEIQTPEQQALAREAREITRQIESLKYAKKEMPEAEYEKQLEDLFLKLARINAKLANKKNPNE